MGGPRAEQIRSWIAGVEVEIREVDAAVAPLVERQAALTERLGLLKRLLTSLSTVDPPRAPSEVAVNGTAQVIRTGGSVRERVQSHALEILREAGKPLHINDLHAEFIKRGFEVPGAGKPNNITVHLSEAAGMVSPARGYYAAREALATDFRVRFPVVDQTKAKRARG